MPRLKIDVKKQLDEITKMVIDLDAAACRVRQADPQDTTVFRALYRATNLLEDAFKELKLAQDESDA